ncbi:hypothetical protein PKOR_03355 [Pontibacter korlensis]|uniref:Uncharacterized protein n=1 Tax=Pontibacter korlensis TaxID=400092 RepID=A0A0E3UV99_9BACT|nr:hypothetical protein PKOR_03355 [Pontibacter korlensis]
MYLYSVYSEGADPIRIVRETDQQAASWHAGRQAVKAPEHGRAKRVHLVLHKRQGVSRYIIAKHQKGRCPL